MECSSAMELGLKEIFDEGVTTLQLRFQPTFTAPAISNTPGQLDGEPSESPNGISEAPAPTNPSNKVDPDMTPKFIEMVKIDDQENDPDSSSSGTETSTKTEDLNIDRVDALLKSPDTTLTDFFREDVRGEFLKEFRLRNKKLIDFLATSENLQDLLEIILKGTSTPQEQFCACELLTSDIQSVLGKRKGW